MSFLLEGILAVTWQQLVMYVVGIVLIWLAVKKEYEPSLLLPLGFGAILVNLPYSGVIDQMVQGKVPAAGIIQWLFETGIEASEAMPILLFIGIGAMIDFGPLLSQPVLFLFGAAAQFGIFAAILIACLLGFDLKDAASIGIIGAADGPTSILVSQVLGSNYMGPIAVAAYSYMALMPLIQPPVMRFLTTKEERQIIMKQPRYVSRLEKIVFPVVIAIIVNLFLPPVAPLITMLMLGNLLRECLCVDRLAETASNALLNIVTLVLTVAIGSTMAADTFLTPNTLLIIALGLVAFIFGTGSGVVCARIMNKISGGRINPLIGSAGIASVPIAARVSHLVGQQENRQNFLIMHAMGPNLAGVFGTAISGGIMLALLVK